MLTDPPALLGSVSAHFQVYPFAVRYLFALSLLGALLLTSSAATGCSPPAGQNASEGGSVEGRLDDQPSFVDRLRSRGLTVEIDDYVRQPFLKVRGVVLRIRGGSLKEVTEIQLFEYEDADAALSDAKRIGPEGSPEDTHIGWLGPPHFFRARRIIVLYVGRDDAVVELLTELLGSQFAGA